MKPLNLTEGAYYHLSADSNRRGAGRADYSGLMFVQNEIIQDDLWHVFLGLKDYDYCKDVGLTFSLYRVRTRMASTTLKDTGILHAPFAHETEIYLSNWQRQRSGLEHVTEFLVHARTLISVDNDYYYNLRCTLDKVLKQ